MTQLVQYITNRLADLYPADEAHALAWWVLEEMTGRSRTELQFDCKDTNNFPNNQKLEEIIDRLRHFEPVQYIFGHTLWMGLDLKVTPATLIPRPETAELVEFVSRYPFSLAGTVPGVLDIGTGSGCIAIALKKRHPDWRITAIDISEDALAVAKENAARNNIEIDFRKADIFSDETVGINPLSGGEDKDSALPPVASFDIIVSNPPYICEKEKAQMRPNVLDHEPQTALFVPDSDPLLFYRRIAVLFAGCNHSARPKYLFFEINEAFPDELSHMLNELGYTDIKVTQDIYGKPRIISCRMA